VSEANAFSDTTTDAEYHDWMERMIDKHNRYLKQFHTLDELFSRRKFSDGVKARIRKAYPNGRVPIGEMLRGWHPHDRLSRAINMDVVGPKKLIEKYGRDAYRSIPKEAFFRHGHRKAVSMSYVMENLSNPQIPT
jgi:hypothetical protein